jgi:hypothetical protein
MANCSLQHDFGYSTDAMQIAVSLKPSGRDIHPLKPLAYGYWDLLVTLEPVPSDSRLRANMLSISMLGNELESASFVSSKSPLKQID